MPFPITALYALPLTLLVFGLGFRVARARMTRAAPEILLKRQRVHGNLVENAPLFLILLALCEGSGGHGVILHGLGASFVGVRVSHAIGLSRSMGASMPRFIGAAGTWTLQVATACYAVGLSWF